MTTRTDVPPFPYEVIIVGENVAILRRNRTTGCREQLVSIGLADARAIMRALVEALAAR